MNDTTNTNTVKYPNVTVELIGRDGNAFAILGSVKRALSAAGVARSEIDEFMAEATSGDYSHLLCTVMRWVEIADVVEDDEDEIDDEWDEYWADGDDDEC